MPAVPLLELENLTISRARPAAEPLVQNLSLRLDRGESLGLVGESGSGKSLTALALMRLLPEREIRVSGGRLHFQGRDLLGLSQPEMKALRGSRLAIIFQDALASLNPVRRVQNQLEEVFRFHGQAIDRDHIRSCLQKAGLLDTEFVRRAYPHELSGGMRQRVMLAMALLLDPDLLIADEPTTALDVTLQARWVEQVQTLRRERQLGLLFISHDIALVADVCERIAVLYKGRLMECAPTTTILHKPAHPYTQAMMQAVPLREQAASVSTGCPFARLCPQAVALCHEKLPEIQSSGSHQVACHLVKL